MDEDLKEYRRFLISAEQKSQEDFDKTVIALSGGALGISFAFVKNFVGEQPPQKPCLLLISWMAWATSVTCVLASLYFSQQALRQAVKQIDSGSDEVYRATPGGVHSHLTRILNALGGLLFLIGVISLAVFASINIL
ncbi:MAG: hypothetical protein H8E35_05445 [Ardenticatenia bacterium]|nr:hypothetical protein [Ardenticatenia bacterium]